MKIKILGSAASDGVPSLFCQCETCRKTREFGGKNIRRRCSYIINDDTIVDYGPDIFMQALDFNIDMNKVKRVFVTHLHDDHLDLNELCRRKVLDNNHRALDFYAPNDFVALLHKHKNISPGDIGLNFHPVIPGTTQSDDNLDFSTIEAAHHAIDNDLAVNYIFSYKGKSILIASDTGWWGKESWEYIKKFKIDAAIIECTFALNPQYADKMIDHLGSNAAVKFRDELVSLGVLSAAAPVWLTHFSHSGNSLHNELENYFKPYNIGICYDGMEINL
jgi:phosphoribosyl 1,2-cyclic phosphate phosphodiesterase